MNERDKRQLQKLMQNPQWEVIERYFEQFLKDNFLLNSVKKDTEFETMWYLAFNEGGKFYMQKFMQELEREAYLADE